MVGGSKKSGFGKRSRTEQMVASKTQAFAFGLTAAMSRSSPQGITDVVELVAHNQHQQLRQKKEYVIIRDTRSKTRTKSRRILNHLPPIVPTRRSSFQTRKDSSKRRSCMLLNQPTPFNDSPQLIREPKTGRIVRFPRASSFHDFHNDRNRFRKIAKRDCPT